MIMHRKCIIMHRRSCITKNNNKINHAPWFCYLIKILRFIIYLGYLFSFFQQP